MPSVTVALPHLANPPTLPSKRPIKAGAAEDDKSAQNAGMAAGKTYPFHLSFTNPMYDPIQVRISVQRAPVAPTSTTEGSMEKRRPPFAVSLPTATFTVAAFAEAWEYDDEDDEDMFDDEFAEIDERIRRTTGRITGKSKTVGVLEKKANTTLIGGEVVIGKEAKGDIKVCDFMSSSQINAHTCLVQHDGHFHIPRDLDRRPRDRGHLTIPCPSRRE